LYLLVYIGDEDDLLSTYLLLEVGVSQERAKNDSTIVLSELVAHDLGSTRCLVSAIMKEMSCDVYTDNGSSILLLIFEGEVHIRTLFVLSSSNRGRLLGITDLMIQKSNRMKQKDQSRHYGILQAGGEHEEFLKIWSKN
ncbi:hypothetical protein Tco_0096790, partial [Tanacetum coccineum]